MSSLKSKVIIILVICLQMDFPVASPWVLCMHFPVASPWVLCIMIHITVCTVTYHRAIPMVMMEAARLCTASLSLCYTATCYGIDDCIGPCRCLGDSEYKDSTFRIPVEPTGILNQIPSIAKVTSVKQVRL